MAGQETVPKRLPTGTTAFLTYIRGRDAEFYGWIRTLHVTSLKGPHRENREKY